MKRLIIVMIGAILINTHALAFDFMGPTTSRLKDSGRTSVGAEYFISSMEIDADSISVLLKYSFVSEWPTWLLTTTMTGAVFPITWEAVTRSLFLAAEQSGHFMIMRASDGVYWPK